MKKIIVSALTVIAIVTSALAFTKSNDKVFCANPDDQNFCNQPVSKRTLIVTTGGSETRNCVAVSQNATCDPVTIYKTND
jgi:hypothetical protein